MADKYENLMSYNNYAILKGVTQQAVRNWVEAGKIERVVIDNRSFVVLTDDEIVERKEKGI